MRSAALSKMIRLLQRAALSTSLPSPQSSQVFSRREMVKLTAQGLVAGVGTSLPIKLYAQARRPLSERSGRLRKRDSSERVVIVGGGISGLVAAYHLQKKGIPSSIYEASDRLGGRMFTRSNFNSEGMFCELGAEVVDTDHTTLMSLCSELGLRIQDLTSEDRECEADIFFADGKLISETQMLQGLQPLAIQVGADLNELWGNRPARCITIADQGDPRVSKYDRLSLAEYLYEKKDVEKWVSDLICSLYTCEFGLDAGEQSALNFLTMVCVQEASGASGVSRLQPLGRSDEKYRIEGGSQSLIQALVRALEPQVEFHLNHPLVHIRETSGGLNLSFQKGSTVQVSAAQVICTVPFSILRAVEGIYDLNLDPALKKCIAELGYGQISKWMIGFKNRFWRKDLKSPSNGAFLSVDHQQFWETSRMQKGASGILTRFLAGSTSKQIPRDSLLRDLEFLESLYPGAKTEFDQNQFLMSWGKFPWTRGCYTCLRPGQYTQFNGLAKEPQLGGRLTFAGEHTSVEYGGFMNGAIESGYASANHVIRSRISPTGFASSIPEWMTADLPDSMTG